jgi:dTMP kinase
LVGRLRRLGLSVHATAEPSRGPIGALIRQILAGRVVGVGESFDRSALALLFAADRLDHARGELLPALRSGKWVVSDRYVLSSLAYQALDLPQTFIATINTLAPRPDLTIFLDVPAEISLRRRRAQASARDLFEDLATQRRVARHYLTALKGVAGVDLGPTSVIDGTQPIAGVEEAIEGILRRRFRIDRPAAKRTPG